MVNPAVVQCGGAVQPVRVAGVVGYGWVVVPRWVGVYPGGGRGGGTLGG